MRALSTAFFAVYLYVFVEQPAQPQRVHHHPAGHRTNYGLQYLERQLEHRIFRRTVNVRAAQRITYHHNDRADGNADEYFTKLCAEKNVPLYTIEKTGDLRKVMPELLK